MTDVLIFSAKRPKSSKKLIICDYVLIENKYPQAYKYSLQLCTLYSVEYMYLVCRSNVPDCGGTRGVKKATVVVIIVGAIKFMT